MNAFDPLDRLFDPAHPCFTAEGVKTLMDLSSDEVTEARMDSLAEKANEGSLTEVERREYESWVRAGTFISLLQAKARLYLKRTAGA
jgi:hypothetical protein